jgi:hypothetical protein
MGNISKTGFKISFWALCAALVSVVVVASCGAGKKDAPSREQVALLLQREAEAMKLEGESDVNPSLGVSVSWTVQAVDLREQPGNEAEPWAATIGFVIESKTPELDGTTTERFERSYDYVWESESERWAMR